MQRLHSDLAAKTRDGTRLAYTLYGPPAATERIALVHSLAMDGVFWRPVAERLADRAAVVTYDCRGHGQSGKPRGAAPVAQHADDLADLMDHLDWAEAVVAGASMGGCISLACAIAHPARVAALGLIDTTAWYGPDAAKVWEERANAARTKGLAALTDFQVTRWFGDAFRAQHPDIVRASVDTFLRNDVEAYAQTCRMLGACDLREGLPAIKIPTAILVGEEDYATPLAMAQALHAAIANSTLTVLKGARHLTPLERPDDIAAALKQLLQHARTPK